MAVSWWESHGTRNDVISRNHYQNFWPSVCVPFTASREDPKKAESSRVHVPCPLLANFLWKWIIQIATKCERPQNFNRSWSLEKVSINFVKTVFYTGVGPRSMLVSLFHKSSSIAKRIWWDFSWTGGGLIMLITLPLRRNMMCLDFEAGHTLFRLNKRILMEIIANVRLMGDVFMFSTLFVCTSVHELLKARNSYKHCLSSISYTTTRFNRLKSHFFRELKL